MPLFVFSPRFLFAAETAALNALVRATRANSYAPHTGGREEGVRWGGAGRTVQLVPLTPSPSEVLRGREGAPFWTWRIPSRNIRRLRRPLGMLISRVDECAASSSNVVFVIPEEVFVMAFRDEVLGRFSSAERLKL